MSENFNYCHVVGKTDVGRKRAANEDSMGSAITQNGLVSVVCDGMGGHVGGATASRVAVAAILDNLNNVFYDDPRIAIGESIDRANQAILRKAAEQPELAGMGSTCVLLLVRGGKVYIGHVGDSRIYLVRSKRIVQLTKDHSYVQLLVDRGEITQEQAEHHPRKNEITNALGIPGMSPATVAEDAIVPEAGDCFVLCSDGLSGMVPNDAICKVIGRQTEMTAQERVDKLVSLANERGGLDNITVQLIEFSVAPNAVTEGKKNKKWLKVSLCVAIPLLLFGAGGYLWLKYPHWYKGCMEILPKSTKVVPIDTLVNLGEVEFVENAKVVEIVYAESSLELKNGEGNTLYKESSAAFDASSLDVDTSHIKPQYNNSLLSFKDQYPGDTIMFSITTVDSTKVYKFVYHVVRGDTKEVRATPTLRESSPTSDNRSRERIIGNDVAKVDTVPIEFEYETLAKGMRLLLRYSGKPSLSFAGGSDKMAGEAYLRPHDNPTYTEEAWKMTHKKGNEQLFFDFQGRSEISSNDYVFVMPCVDKNDSAHTIVIKVTLSKKPASKGTDPGEANEG